MFLLNLCFTHKRCWFEEEEHLLIRLKAQFGGNKTISKLIAKHILSKTGKQMNDKRRLLPREAAVGMGTEPGMSHCPDNEEEQLGTSTSRGRGSWGPIIRELSVNVFQLGNSTPSHGHSSSYLMASRWHHWSMSQPRTAADASIW